MFPLVRSELSATMGLTAKPVLSRSFFHERGIPQYLVGHGKVLERIEERLPANPRAPPHRNAHPGGARQNDTLPCPPRTVRPCPTTRFSASFAPNCRRRWG